MKASQSAVKGADVADYRLRAQHHRDMADEHRKSVATLKAKTEKVKKGFTMSNDLNFEELFSGELTKSVDADDRVIIHCPHCAEGITKSQVISKAEKGKMVDQNNEGKNKRGGKDGAHNKATPTRPKGATAKTNEPNPGAYDTKKSVVGNADDASADDTSADDASAGDKGQDVGEKSVMKSTSSTQQMPRVLGGSSYVTYIDSGEDARIADRILKGINGHNANDRTPHNGH